MAQGVALQQISSVLGKALSAKTPQVAITKEAVNRVGAVSNDLFGYDFMGLGVKLIVYFGIALIFSKFMEAVIFTRGVFLQIVSLLGVNVPKADELPDSLKKLFSEGLNGFKFWDIVKIIAILLVIAEFMKYVNSNRKAGSSSSPMTIGVFILIITALAVTTVPELMKRIKTTDFNLDSLR